MAEARMRVTINHVAGPGMFGIKRYAEELARALAPLGVDARLRSSRKVELRLGRLRVGGLVTEALRNWVPIVRRGLLHAADHKSNPHLPPADIVNVQDLIPSERPDLVVNRSLSARDRREAQRAVDSGAAILTSTEPVRQSLLRQYAASPDQVHTIPLGVHHEVFYPEVGGAPEPLLRPGMLNVVTTSSVEHRKRLDLVGQAALALPYVHLIHLGNPAYPPRRPELQRQTEAALAPLRAQGRLSQPGRVDDPTMRRILSQADVVVQPSEAEGFGLTPVEALACGARVVASDIPQHRDVLGDAVRYVPIDAAALARFLEACWDGEAVREAAFPPRKARLAQAALYSWERTARQTMAVYAAQAT